MRIATLVLSLALAACGGAAPPEPRSFDLGLEAPASKLPPVRVAAVRAVAPFEGNDMHYRLGYRNAAEIAPFANSRWSASPAELLRKQLLRAASDRGGKCALEVEVQEFTQLFSAKEASEARLELRAWLVGASGRIASRGWSVSEPNAGADAERGAAAMARAANRAVGEIARWISTEKDCL